MQVSRTGTSACPLLLAYLVLVTTNVTSRETEPLKFAPPLKTATRPYMCALSSLGDSLHVPVPDDREAVHSTVSYNQNLWIAHLSGGAAYLPR